MSFKRQKLLVDRSVQLSMVTRVLFQWFTFLAAVVIVLPMFRAIVLGDATTPLALRAKAAGIDAAILLVVFLAFLPYFVYDTFKLTNRFAGPMFRLRRTLKSIADGAPLRPLKFRKGDFWHDVANDFNRMATRLQNSPPPVELAAEDVERTEAEAMTAV